MKKYFLPLFFGIIFIFSGCNSEETTDDPEETKFQTVSAEKITIEKPPEWEVLERSEHPEVFPPNVFLLMSEIEPWGEGETFATVAIAKEVLPANTSVRKYAEAALKKTEEEIIDYEKLDEEIRDIQGIEAKYLAFRGRHALGEEILEWQHLFLAKDDVGYVVSTTSPIDASDEQKELLKTILFSFSFAEETDL